jgi:ferric-dicitrate binding protein FerR (iron transport regulator)
MVQEQRVWLLYSLKLSGEATLEDLAELDVYLEQDPALHECLEVLDNFWKQKAESDLSEKEEAFGRHLQRLSTHLGEPVLQYAGTKKKVVRKYAVWWWSGAVAASILLCFVCWFFFVSDLAMQPGDVRLSHNTICTKPGSKTSIRLPDGSRVWLNADSKITYSGDFQGAVREVYLWGEAFFDVAKDLSRPFIIHTSAIDLKVLGTAFNVRSYVNEKETETSLVHGSVEVTLRQDPDQKIILKPSEKLVVKNRRADTASNQPADDKKGEEEPLIVLGRMHYIGRDSSSIETSWIKNQLAFNKENLDQIASKIERWYNVKVQITDSSLKEGAYTGLFEDETLEEVLEALRLSGGFQYTIKKREITISP